MWSWKPCFRRRSNIRAPNLKPVGKSLNETDDLVRSLRKTSVVWSVAFGKFILSFFKSFDYAKGLVSHRVNRFLRFYRNTGSFSFGNVKVVVFYQFFYFGGKIFRVSHHPHIPFRFFAFNFFELCDD